MLLLKELAFISLPLKLSSALLLCRSFDFFRRLLVLLFLVDEFELLLFSLLLEALLTLSILLFLLCIFLLLTDGLFFVLDLFLFFELGQIFF